jgi:hypothetical protein
MRVIVLYPLLEVVAVRVRVLVNVRQIVRDDLCPVSLDRVSLAPGGDELSHCPSAQKQKKNSVNPALPSIFGFGELLTRLIGIRGAAPLWRRSADWQHAWTVVCQGMYSRTHAEIKAHEGGNQPPEHLPSLLQFFEIHKNVA